MMKENIISLPEGWCWSSMDKIGEVVTGTTPRKSKKEYYGNEYPFFKPKDLNEGYYVRKSKDGLSKKGFERTRRLPEKSVLVTCIGATIGKTGLTRVSGASNQQINAIITNKEIVPEFVYFMCISPNLQKEIEVNASSTTLPILNKTKFERLPIPLPPLPEQHKIVEEIEELFTKLDAGVEALKKVKEQIKQYRQSVLKSAFEGKLTADWRQRMLNDELGILNEKEDNLKSRIDNSELKNLPELPKGWEWTNFERIGEVNPRFNKNSFKTDLEVTFLPMRNVEAESGKIDLSLIKKISYILKKSYTYFGNGDILFAKITPCMENGKVAIADGLKNGIGFGSTEFHVIRLSKDFSRKFFFYYIIQEKFRKEAERNMKGTAGHMRVPTNYIKKVPIVFAPFPEQQKIVEEIEKRFSIADEVEQTVNKSLEQAEKLRQSILKKAFEGKLTEKWREEHPELVSGENSAEKLLEKIKEEKAKLKAETKNKRKRKKK